MEHPTINAVMGILMDLRGITPTVASGFTEMALKHGIAPLEGPFRCAVVVIGKDGERYDATALGEAAITDLDR